MWIPDVRIVAEYYVFVTKKIVKLELKGHCEHLPSSHYDFYVSHCYGGCGHALRCADHQGRPYVPRKRWATSLWTSQGHLLKSWTMSERSVQLQAGISAGSLGMSEASSQQAPDGLTDHIDNQEDKIRILSTTYSTVVVPYVPFYVESRRLKYQHRGKPWSGAHPSL